jgi:hypothetical protein
MKSIPRSGSTAQFAEAVRPVFFQTQYEEFLYATHGGTLFLVVFRGRVYGVTCAHVFGDFPHGRLFVTQEKRAQKGSMPGHVTGLAYPSSPTGGAVGTDVTDLCIIQFSEDTSPDFFSSPWSARALADCSPSVTPAGLAARRRRPRPMRGSTRDNEARARRPL